MKLSEIITISESGTTGILIESIVPYKKSLQTYYKSYYNCEPVLIVTAVFNACQYGFIAPSNEMSEAIETYINETSEGMSDEDIENELELINFQSIMLSSL